MMPHDKPLPGELVPCELCVNGRCPDGSTCRWCGGFGRIRKMTPEQFADAATDGVWWPEFMLLETQPD